MRQKDPSSRSHTRPGRALSLCVAAAAVLAGCATMGPALSQRVDSASVSYSVAGIRTPVVVFEAGLGDSKSSWTAVAAKLADDATVFAYDRPGYGRSSGFNDRFATDADGRRTGQEVATHLRELLTKAGIQPPFVLVGHSSGGLYVLSFAKLYPEDVAGIVLVDGRPAGFTAACKAEDAGMCEPPGVLVATMPPHMKAEVKGIAETEAFAPRAQELGAIPITVITATQPDFLSSRDFQELWLRHQKAFAQGAANARYVEAAGSTHYVHDKRPELVISEIRLMLDQLRSTPGHP